MIRNMVGKKFGMLTVISRAPNKYQTDVAWHCLCDCGNETITIGRLMRSGHTKSCGCFRKEAPKYRTKNYPGHPTHGLSKERIYKIWKQMKARCETPAYPAYKDYGGRGITICAEWHDPVVFVQWAKTHGYTPELTIDRINNNAGYSPDNCRFITQAEQTRNTRKNRYVKSGDSYITTSQVSKIIGVSPSAVSSWYRKRGLRSLDQFIAMKKVMKGAHRNE